MLRTFVFLRPLGLRLTYFSNHSSMKSFTNWEFFSYEEEIYGMIK
ncbi:hypothetical protein PTB13_16950 [Bacillus sp. MHSD17]|nr:hypothetical protein [Bacillus sp. MHSD17]